MQPSRNAPQQYLLHLLILPSLLDSHPLLGRYQLAQERADRSERQVEEDRRCAEEERRRADEAGRSEEEERKHADEASRRQEDERKRADAATKRATEETRRRLEMEEEPLKLRARINGQWK